MVRDSAFKWALSLLMILVLPENGAAVWFTLPAHAGSKCLSEQIYGDVVILGHYFAFSDSFIPPAPTMAVEVKSPQGNTLYLQKNVTSGQFGFTTTEAGSYTACFWVDSNQANGNLTVSIDWKTGVFTKDWESIAKAEKIEGLELELRKLEESVQAIRNNTIKLMLKDLRMQRVSRATNTKVARLSLMSVGVCIVVSALQVWQLKRFFRKKKLI